MRNTPTRPVYRRGLTLLEILVSLAILGGTLAAVQRLTNAGSLAALRAEGDSQAALRCQSQLDALLAGAITAPTGGWQVCREDPEWSWSADLATLPDRGLVRVTVSVQRTSADLRAGRCRLTRLVRATTWSDRSRGRGT